MKGKELADIYNQEPNKDVALNAVKQNYILSFKNLTKERKPKEVHEFANIYCELENKWMAFCLRVSDVPVETFREFMSPAFPLLSVQILKHLEE